MKFLMILQLLIIKGARIFGENASSSDCVSNGDEPSERKSKGTYKSRKFMQDIIDDYFLDREDFLDETITRRVSKEFYIESSLAIIKKHLGPLDLNEESQMYTILSLIHASIGSDSKSLALFTSLALQSTSYLTKFSTSSSEKYRARGLLMISGPHNYKLLNSFSRGTNFVKCPDEVSNQSPNVVNATVCFFKYMMEGKEYNFLNMMRALNSDEYSTYIMSGRVKKDARWRNREKLYKMMMALY